MDYTLLYVLKVLNSNVPTFTSLHIWAMIPGGFISGIIYPEKSAPFSDLAKESPGDHQNLVDQIADKFPPEVHLATYIDLFDVTICAPGVPEMKTDHARVSLEQISAWGKV